MRLRCVIQQVSLRSEVEPLISEATKGKYAGTPIIILGGASSVGQIGMFPQSVPPI